MASVWVATRFGSGQLTPSEAQVTSSRLMPRRASWPGVPFVQVAQALPPELTQGRPGGESPGSMRRLGNEVGRRPDGSLPLSLQIGGGQRHGGRVGRRIGTEHVAGLVGDVQPLVPVDGPRVGQLDP